MGTTQLADEVFLAALDLERGSSRWPQRAQGVVLAGALLAELVLVDAVSVAGGQVRATGRGAVGDRLQAVLVKRTIELGRGHAPGSVRLPEWLAAFASGSTGVVADRLVAAGLLRRELRRRFGATSVRWRPVDPGQVLIASQRALAHARTGVGLSVHSIMVAAFVVCAEPDLASLGLPQGALGLLRDPRGVLPTDLWQALEATRDALDAAIISRT